MQRQREHVTPIQPTLFLRPNPEFSITCITPGGSGRMRSYVRPQDILDQPLGYQWVLRHLEFLPSHRVVVRCKA